MLLGDMTREQLEQAYESVRTEYNVTIRVLSVVTERLLVASGAAGLTITDQALVDSPDLQAHRDEMIKQIYITVSR